jgi:hypothetical protein
MFNDLYKTLNLANPYDRYKDSGDLKSNIVGWNGNSPFFERIIKETKPFLIIEVGSFLGQSAINMGNVIKLLEMDTKILCIDTWLGSDEHWRDDLCNLMHLFENFKNGISSLYDQFIQNVMISNLDDRIIPIPNTSTVGYKMMKWKNLKADLIYIDGSHDKDDVKKDIRMFWEILNHGGVMFGDDYNSWKDVREAVDEASREMSLDLTVEDSNFWVFRKV